MEQIHWNRPVYFQNVKGFGQQVRADMVYGSQHMPILISDSPVRPSFRVLHDFDLNVPLPGIFEFFWGLGYKHMPVDHSDAESDKVVEVINVDSSSEANTNVPPPGPDPVPNYNQLQEWQAAQKIRSSQSHKSIPPNQPGPCCAFHNPDPNLYLQYYQLLQSRAQPSPPVAYQYANWYSMHYQGQQAYHHPSASTSSVAQAQFSPSPIHFGYDVEHARSLIRMFGRQ